MSPRRANVGADKPDTLRAAFAELAAALIRWRAAVERQIGAVLMLPFDLLWRCRRPKNGRP